MKNEYRDWIRVRNMRGGVLTMFARGWGLERKRRFLFWRESDQSLRVRVLERMESYAA